MAPAVKALIVSTLVGVIGLWAFNLWRDRSVGTESESSLKFIERLETQGLPPLEITGTDGRIFKLSDHAGKAVLINFWASWCAPCLEEVPSMLKLVREMNGRLVLLALSQDSKEEEIAAFFRAFPEVNNPNVYVAWDRSKSFSKEFRVGRLPESYLADSTGKLAKKVVGSIQWYTPDSVRYVESLIKK